MDVFWERGYTSTSASDLADAMGISRSSFYNSFGDKDAVFREVVDVYLDRAPDAILARLGPRDPVLPALWQMFRELCRVRAADRRARGCLVVNSIAEIAGASTELGVSTAETARRRIAQLARLLRRAAAQGEMPSPADPRHTAAAMVTFLCGVNVISKALRSEKALWRICRDTLTGLGLPPPEARIRAGQSPGGA